MPRTPDDILDELLVLQAQDGRGEAIDALVRRWQPRLMRHARRLTGDRDAAEEVAQEVWLAVASGLRRLRDPAHFRAWVYRIATNKAADWVRRRARERDFRNRAGLHEPAAPAHDLKSGDRAEGDERIALLREALRMLPFEHRAVIEMHYGDGLRVAEIAHALDIPPGTVKSRLHYARRKLGDAAMEHAERAVADRPDRTNEGKQS